MHNGSTQQHNGERDDAPQLHVVPSLAQMFFGISPDELLHRHQEGSLGCRKKTQQHKKHKSYRAGMRITLRSSMTLEDSPMLTGCPRASNFCITAGSKNEL